MYKINFTFLAGYRTDFCSIYRSQPTPFPYPTFAHTLRNSRNKKMAKPHGSGASPIKPVRAARVRGLTCVVRKAAALCCKRRLCSVVLMAPHPVPVPLKARTAVFVTSAPTLATLRSLCQRPLDNGEVRCCLVHVLPDQNSKLSIKLHLIY